MESCQGHIKILLSEWLELLASQEAACCAIALQLSLVWRMSQAKQYNQSQGQKAALRSLRLTG